MKKGLVLATMCLFVCAAMSACAGKSPLSAKNPTTITMWHNYGGSMQNAVDELIDEFNGTVGKEKGIIVNVSAVSSSADLQDAYDKILDNDPGAPEMPDITSAYPKTAVLFYEQGLLANLDEYFTKEELSGYIPSFVEEGRLVDGGLYVFPIAKSTEILYVNKTLFDEFSKATGITDECFGTFEKLTKAARAYYDWSGGKAFFASDAWANVALVGMEQKGSSLFSNDTMRLSSSEYEQIWNTLVPSVMRGEIALYSGYSSDLAKTGDIICSTGSSAGALFYGDTVTYEDGTVRDVEYAVYPYPVFEGGQKKAIQRGNGMMVKKSDKAHEYAASEFLRWFTSPENNTRFVSSTGYLPVTAKAFEENLPVVLNEITDIRISRMLNTVLKQYDTYEFFVPPTFAEYDSMVKSYNSTFVSLLQEKKDQFEDGGEVEAAVKEALEDFKTR